jgi:hypothetical protein
MFSWLDLVGKHRERTGVIICNGGTLGAVPRQFLSKYLTIGTNGIFKLPFQPTYYIAVNELVIQEFREGIKSLPSTKFIKEKFAEEFEALPLHSDYQDSLFSKTPYTWIYEGGTVTHVALQIAYFLGFQTVLMVGLDHRYTYKGQPNEEMYAEDIDVNHFCKDYFPAGSKWNNPDLAQSEISYAEARKVFEADNRRIINLTPNTSETVFEKGTYWDYL